MVLSSAGIGPEHFSKEKKDTVNLKLVIEYDGKNYFGWQRQKNKPSIQQTIEESLQILLSVPKITINGAGRTDAGVHALNQSANFRISKDLFKKLDLHKLVYRLNALLPRDITIKSIDKVKDDFHARYSAKKRVYKYLISTVKKSFNGDKYYRIKTPFDLSTAKNFCSSLEGIHSFKSLCKNKTDTHNFNCIVYYVRIRKKGATDYEFEICANRFLHSMVRAVTGVMIALASGELSMKDFKEKFIKGENIRTQFVPANALILEKIIY